MTSTKKIEFGDFQTPACLAGEIVAFLRDADESPDVIVEPTCGLGSFVAAAVKAFPRAKSIHAFDINAQHLRDAQAGLGETGVRSLHFHCQDFFHFDWPAFFSSLKGDVLVVGNPPWVTNSALGALGSTNLPQKSNFQRHIGFAAKTGKANFDISEWILIKLIEALQHRDGCVAMLCKTSTARKTLRHAWLNKLDIGRSSVHLIDAQKHFGVSVDACLLVMHTGTVDPGTTAPVYPDLSFDGKLSTMGLAGKELVADIDEYLRLRDIDGIPYYTWRSGVKHDAAGVMEFKRVNNHYANSTDEDCQLEPTYLFPLLKSSDIANGRKTTDRYVLVTQRKPSDDTAAVKNTAPKTWAYLTAHADVLDNRRSIIYQKRPRFSVFGIGEYTFSPWKVAVSGLYKNCHFQVVGEHHGKPVVVDDTCYFIPCASEKEARFVCGLLNSDVCQRFLRSLVFLDAKRPITVDILNRIDLRRVAEHVNKASEAGVFLSAAATYEDRQPLLLLEKEAQYKTKKRTRRRKPTP